jgi:phospholipid/cholesterol/gamma-HCH transport system substrate-binding protein
MIAVRMRSFRERDPLAVGLFGMAAVGVVVLGAFNLTVLQGGTDYYAAFTEASGLKPNEDVRIAGVKVGKVKGVTLEGDHVRVAFNVRDGVRFGSLSRAQIKISNILGAHYLDVRPGGTDRQPSHAEIPISRTVPSYEVVPALQDLSGRLDSIDTSRLARAFDSVSETLRNSPENVRRSLDGLRKISRAVSSRDDSLSGLLVHSKGLTSMLADRSGDLAALVSDGGLLLQEIDKRRETVRSLLSGTVSLAEQITGTVQENRATLHPALVQLHKVIDLLTRNQGNLEGALRNLASFVVTSGEATGSGRWFDGYLQNLVPVPTSVALPGQTKEGPR